MSDKENLFTPKANEVKKRQLLQSPYTAGTPGTRPAPRKVSKPFRDLGDPNLEATQIADETFNMSSIKGELDECAVQEPPTPAAVSSTAYFADPNVEESFVERRSVMCGEIVAQVENLNFPRPSEENIARPLVLPSVTLPDQSRLKASEMPYEKSSGFGRSGDANLEESAMESSMYDMDVTQRNVSQKENVHLHCLQETLVLMDEENDTTLKNEEPQEPQVIDVNVTMAECEEVGQQQDAVLVEVPLKGDSVFASVEAVMLCERKDAHPLLEDGPTLACELLDSGVEGKITPNTEVGGSVNVSILSMEAPASPPKDSLPCISNRPSDFSFTSAVRSNISTLRDNEVKPQEEEEDATYIQDFNETELVFAEPLALASDDEYGKSEKSSPEGDNAAAVNISSMDISTVVDDTMMVFREPAKFVASLADEDVFPAHYGTTEVESRFLQPESVDTVMAYEPLVQKDPFDIKGQEEEEVQEGEAGRPQSPNEDIAVRVLENANVGRTRGVVHAESLSSEAVPIVPASENAEELQAGDSESIVSDRITEGRASARSSAIPRYKSPLSPIADESRGGTISRESSVPRSFGSEASTPVYPNRRKYHMNDSEISFMINEIKVLTDEEQRKSHLEQLTENLSQLEAEKAELSEGLRAVSAELNEYKERSTTQEIALAEANRKLNEMEKAKEHAERTVADYEFIVTDLKQRHIKQKEDLHAKLIAQEEELEKYRVIVQSQEDLTYASADLSAQLAAINERLAESEAARTAAEKRCEDLKEELETATRSAADTVALSDEVTSANHELAAMRAKLAELEKEILDRDEALLTANRRHAEEYIKLQEKLNETALSLQSSEELVESLKKQLCGTENERDLLRDVQIANELELMKTVDELSHVKRALEEKEKDREEAIRRRDATEEEVNQLRNQLKQKTEFFERQLSEMSSMEEKYAAAQEQLEAEKLARDVANREIIQLRDENYTVSELLEKAKAALVEAERKAATAERNLVDHIKCHTEELDLRVSELENMVAASQADKQALTLKLEEKLEEQTALTNEVKKAGEVISKLEIEVTDAKKEKSALVEELKLGKELYEEKAAETEKVAAEFAELQTFSKSLELEKKRLKEELSLAIEKAKQNEAISQQVVESLKVQIATLTAERDSLKDRLTVAEDYKANLEKDLVEIRESALRSKAQMANLISASAKMEEEWKEKEKVYMDRINAAEEAIKRMPQLEMTVEYLKSEAEALNLEIKEASSKLDIEVESKEKATNALTALEGQYNSLQEAKREVEMEYEKARKLFDVERSAAQKVTEELKQSIAILENRLVVEETSAKEKVDAAAAEVARLDTELRKSKAALAEAELQMDQYRQKTEELMEKYLLLESKLAETCNREPEQNSKETEKEIKELKRLLELKSKEVDRLGELCDEFDDIEANYRQKVFNLIRERDQLKALLDPSAIPEVPNLRAALTEGVQMLSPEATLVANDERVVDSKLLELQKIVEQLTEENTRLQQRRTTEDTKMAKEIEDLRRRCKLQENRILELEKICDDVDETESKLRRRIIELEKEISAQKGSPLKAKVAAPRLLDALQHREEDDEREEERIEAGKEAPYVSAPTSPQLVQKSLDETESPMYEESVVESATTPNRSLHTTLYKRLDKTAKLSDTPESKANTSRCAQQ